MERREPGVVALIYVCRRARPASRATSSRCWYVAAERGLLPGPNTLCRLRALMSAQASRSIAAISGAGGEMKRGPAFVRDSPGERGVIGKQAADPLHFARHRGVRSSWALHGIPLLHVEKMLSGSSLYSPNGQMRSKPNPS